MFSTFPRALFQSLIALGDSATMSTTMLRTRIATSFRAVASSSSSSSLHTSAILQARRPAKKVKVSKNQAKEMKKHEASAAQKYAVLGLPAGSEQQWQDCDLAKVLVKEDSLHSNIPPETLRTLEGTIELPRYLNYGVGGGEKRLLFEILPSLAAEKGASSIDQLNNHEEAIREELGKAKMFAKLIDLRNANAKGIAYENRKRCVEAFSAPGKSNDTGRPEVQAAILTMRIRHLWNHLTTYKRDIANRRGLRSLVHQRGKVLKYLKRLDRDRYEALLPRLGLQAESVEGELRI